MVRMMGSLALVAALLGVSFAAAADEWAEAAGYAQRYGGSKDASERAQAASKLAVGMDGKHDKTAVGMLLAILSNECAKDEGGKSEDKVSGEVLMNCEDSVKKAGVKHSLHLLLQ